MYIVKLKPDIIEGDDQYNTYFRGRYVYAYNWYQLIPFAEDWDNPEIGVTPSEFITLERGEDIDHDYLALGYGDYEDYIDKTLTERANSIKPYIVANSLVKEPVDEGAMTSIKTFRSGLAQYILDCNEDGFDWYTDSDQLELMLKYYANGMTNCTVHNLELFLNTGVVKTPSQSTCDCEYSSSTNKTSSSISNTTTVSVSGCGCGISNNYTGTYYNSCDPIFLYRTGIYNYMTRTFSDIDFWSANQNREVLEWMNTILNKILELDLPLTSSVVNKFDDCVCNNVDSSAQVRYRTMLSNLSKAIILILDGKIESNRNFIIISFENWAKYLYERMYWG